MEGKIWNKIVDLSCYLNIFPNFFLSNPVFHISFSKFKKNYFRFLFERIASLKLKGFYHFHKTSSKFAPSKIVLIEWNQTQSQITKYLGLCLRLQSLNWNEMFDLYFFSVSIFIINFVININHIAWSNGVQF